jgi:hypothetical protein
MNPPGISTQAEHIDIQIRRGDEMRKAFRVLLALCALLWISPLQAEDTPPPKVHKQGNYTYMTGGAEEAERKAMFKVAAKYPIQLIFAKDVQEGDMRGVKVTLRNVSGDPVLEAVSEGPYFYVNPPASGRYTFDVEYNGEKKSVMKDLVGRRYLVLEFKFGVP